MNGFMSLGNQPDGEIRSKIDWGRLVGYRGLTGTAIRPSSSDRSILRLSEAI